MGTSRRRVNVGGIGHEVIPSRLSIMSEEKVKKGEIMR